jgi:signal transduction histidine kinase/CheY-like chemotaxis protein
VKYCIFGLAGLAYLSNPWFSAIVIQSHSFAALIVHIAAIYLCIGLYVFSFLYQIFSTLSPWHLGYWYISSCFCLPFFGGFMFMLCPSSPFWLGHLLIAHLILFSLLSQIEFLSIALLGNISSFLTYLALGKKLSYSHLLVLYSYLVLAVLYALPRKVTLDELELSSMRAKLASCTEFIRYISHELRLPLQGIRGVSDLLAQAIENKSTQQKLQYVNVLRASCTQLIMVASNALDLSRFQSGYRSIERKECNFNTLLEEVVAEFEALSTLQGTQVSIYCPRVRVAIDAIKIKHVLRNLVANALGHTKGGKVSLQAFLVRGSILHVSVLDTGLGIPADKINSIFKQGDLDSNYNSGLGLSLASHFVKLHGGTIWVENNIPQGSIFSFTLHLPEAESINAITIDGSECIALENVTEHTRNLVNAWYRGSLITAVIVDDDELSLLSSKLVMEELGFKVLTARSCFEAKQLISQEKECLVLLDAIVTGDDMQECLANIQRDSKQASVILQSGIAQGGLINAFRGSGVIAYLAKPYGVSEVRRILSAIQE